MKTIAIYEGGSKSYGISTPFSDKDIRFVFVHTDISRILGLERHDYESKQNNEEDSFGWELRHFLGLSQKGNTQILELLFNDTWLEITPEFKEIQEHRHELIDSHRVYLCLKGYSHSERYLTLGKKTGNLGSKRKISLEKFGYSYKNLFQFLRLCLAGAHFFQTGIFPVNIRELDKDNLLYSIKTTPENFTINDAIKYMNIYEKFLHESYRNIKVIYSYNNKIANSFCFKLYYPSLKKYNNNT
jgi:predicted nucleotidyltransferase